MATPKISHPTFPVVIPSSKKKVRIRAYTGQEEKILLVAQVSDDPDDRTEAVKQIVGLCVVGDFNVDTAPLFDIEFLFLRLRAISVNNIVELSFIDETDVNEVTGPRQHEFKVDLDQVTVNFPDDHSNRVEFSGGVGAVLRYPTFEGMEEVKAVLLANIDGPSQSAGIDALYSVYARSIESMWDEDKIYQAGVDFTLEEAIDFVNTLPSLELGKIQQFFNTIPTIYYKLDYTTSSGESKSIELTGLEDFFIL